MSASIAVDGGPKIEQTYDYVSLDGELVYQACRQRFADGSITTVPRTPDDESGWRYSLDDVERLPYLLAKLAKSAAGKGIVVVNSESDADLLSSLGICATTCLYGLGSWSDDLSPWFAARSVFILVGAGTSAAGADRVSAQLAGVAKRVKVFDLVDDRGELQTLTDWLGKGYTKDDLSNLINEAPVWQPPPPSDEQGSDGEEWEIPIDIFAKLRPPALDTALLPEPIRDYVQDQAELVGVDPGVIGIAALVVCASAIDDEIQIQPKQHEYGWTESARLWGAVVGDPSVKKSPGLKKATSPMRGIDIELNEKNGQKMHEFMVDEKIYKKLEDAYVKDATAAREAGIDPTTERPKPAEHPECERAIVEDSTIEKLSEILRYSRRGILCLRDELSGWFGSMDAYSNGKAGKDRPLWLEAYNGGARNIDRIGRGTFVVPNWSVCMLGGIQPDLMRSISSSLGDDGLLQRFIVVMAQDVPRGVDRPVNRNAADRYQRLIGHLFHVKPSGSPTLLSPEAVKVRTRLDDKVREWKATAVVSGALMSHFAKWEGLYPRLLLTYHAIECAAAQVHPSVTVSGETAQRVYEFMMKYLFAHSAHFYIDVLDRSDHMEHGRWLAEFVLSRQMESISRRDIVAHYRELRQASHHKINVAMGFLEAAGWVKPTKRGSEGATRWDVNPQIHVRFAELARTEKERRSDARRAIQNIFDEVKGS